MTQDTESLFAAEHPLRVLVEEIMDAWEGAAIGLDHEFLVSYEHEAATRERKEQRAEWMRRLNDELAAQEPCTREGVRQ